MREELRTILQSVRPALTPKQWKRLEKAEQLVQEFCIQPTRLIGVTPPEETLAVCRILARLNQDASSLCAALLFPIARNQLLSKEEIKASFGREVSLLCESLANLPSFSFPELTGQHSDAKHEQALLQQQGESFRKMLLSMAQDMRVVILQFCERLYRLRNLEFISTQQQRVIAHECREIYAPLANRLGISWLKNELEDLTLRYLHPQAFYSLVANLDATQTERQGHIEQVTEILQELVSKHQIPCEILGRPKHINSIYRKMQKRQIDYEELYDLTAFRLLCDTKDQCYQLLGIIHDRWKPIPGRFKDYIAMPKPNMYQSLHTTVLGPDNTRMEIQIRTHEMHQLAEEGIAAHWLYKENDPQQASVETFQWLRSLLRLKDERDDAQDFMASVRDHLQEGEIFVFTPKGHVKELPKGATPVDFAYSIHTDVGHRCTGAKVNNKLVPLRQPLKTGDIVDIQTSPSSEPNQGWLQFVKTHRAKSKIRSFLRSEQRQHDLALGKERLEKELPSTNRSLNKLIKQGALDPILEKRNLSTLDEVFLQIGQGKINPRDIVEVLFPSEKKEASIEELIPFKPTIPKRSGRSIKVDGLDDVMVQMARCCNPIPGDNIIGFISRGRGVIVHRTTCSEILDNEHNRFVEVSWDDSQSASHTVQLRVVSEDRSGLLSLLSRAFADLDIDISAAYCETNRDEAISVFKCQVSDVNQLKHLIRLLEEIRGVISVERIRH